MHVLTPTQLIVKAEAREKERQKAEERKVQSTFSVLQACTIVLEMILDSIRIICMFHLPVSIAT